MRVDADGGTPETITTPDIAIGEVGHVRPQVLPNGKSVLFSITVGDGGHAAVLSLETGEWTGK